MINLGIKVFLDSANIGEMAEATEVDGFTTNPTLMRRAGVVNYESWAKSVLSIVKPRPVSFEVLADDTIEMERQARKIASWGDNVYVKIPVMNTKSIRNYALIEKLSQDGIQVNVTAITEVGQVAGSSSALRNGALSIVSVFAGRIADTGRDGCAYMANAAQILRSNPGTSLLWASTRQVFNIIEAKEAGAHIITVTPDILAKINLLGKDLLEFSRETVQQFYDDAQAAGYTL